MFSPPSTTFTLQSWCKIRFQKFVTCYLMCWIWNFLEGLLITNNSKKDYNIFYQRQFPLTLIWILYTMCLLFFFITVQLLLVLVAKGSTRITYGGYDYPDWAIALGWSSAAVSMIWIPLYMIFRLCQGDKYQPAQTDSKSTDLDTKDNKKTVWHCFVIFLVS